MHTILKCQYKILKCSSKDQTIQKRDKACCAYFYQLILFHIQIFFTLVDNLKFK